MENDCEKLTHIRMVVYTCWCWHIYKGNEVGVDVDQLGDETEVRKVPQSGPDAGCVRPVRVTYDDAGRAEKLESDRTLVLRPIATDRTCPVMSGT